MLWKQSVAMNREKGRPYLGEAALFLRKMESGRDSRGSGGS